VFCWYTSSLRGSNPQNKLPKGGWIGIKSSKKTPKRGLNWHFHAKRAKCKKTSRGSYFKDAILSTTVAQSPRNLTWWAYWRSERDRPLKLWTLNPNPTNPKITLMYPPIILTITVTLLTRKFDTPPCPSIITIRRIPMDHTFGNASSTSDIYGPWF